MCSCLMHAFCSVKVHLIEWLRDSEGVPYLGKRICVGPSCGPSCGLLSMFVLTSQTRATRIGAIFSRSSTPTTRRPTPTTPSSRQRPTSPSSSLEVTSTRSSMLLPQGAWTRSRGRLPPTCLRAPTPWAPMVPRGARVARLLRHPQAECKGTSAARKRKTRVVPSMRQGTR